MREPAQTLVGELERIVSALPDAVLFPGMGPDGARRFYSLRREPFSGAALRSVSLRNR